MGVFFVFVFCKGCGSQNLGTRNEMSGLARSQKTVSNRGYFPPPCALMASPLHA